MVSCELFLDMYWRQYILLEKEFCKSLNFVSLSKDNYNTFSNAFIKLILQIGSEIDVSLKMLCGLFEEEYQGSNILAHMRCIENNDNSFFAQVVKVRTENEDLEIEPWKDYKHSEGTCPYWWTVYNKVKHERTRIGEINHETKAYYKFANLKNALFGLAALYHVLVFSYYRLAENDTIKKRYVFTPLPGSRLFRLTGDLWDSVTFYDEFAFRVDNDGYLIMEYGFPYN